MNHQIKKQVYLRYLCYLRSIQPSGPLIFVYRAPPYKWDKYFRRAWRRAKRRRCRWKFAAVPRITNNAWIKELRVVP